MGRYLTSTELKQLDELLEYAADDTLSCWVATRVNGASASMACDGNVSLLLIKALDKHIKPILKNEK